MKKFACGDVVPGCDAIFSASSMEGILEQVGAHARTAHGLQSVSPELASSVMAAIN